MASIMLDRVWLCVEFRAVGRCAGGCVLHEDSGRLQQMLPESQSVSAVRGRRREKTNRQVIAAEGRGRRHSVWITAVNALVIRVAGGEWYAGNINGR